MENIVKELLSSGLGSRGHMILGMSFSKPIKNENFSCFCCCSVAQSCLTVTPWTAAHQASLSFTISGWLLKFMYIESVRLSDIPSSLPSIQLVIHPAQYFAWCTLYRGDDICHSLLLLPSIFPSMRVFSIASAFHNRWPNYWSFSFSISSSNEYSGLISFRIDQLYLLAVQGTFRSLL